MSDHHLVKLHQKQDKNQDIDQQKNQRAKQYTLAKRANSSDSAVLNRFKPLTYQKTASYTNCINEVNNFVARINGLVQDIYLRL
jgi:trehalose-6-phosphate synthase